MKPVWIGCAGWSYQDWKGRLYPKGLPSSRWLERYAESFETVEVNSTFYGLPTENTVAKWVERTPDHFRFAVKVSRYLTHRRRLKNLDRGFERFWGLLEPVREAGKLGPILWQLPASFHRDDDLLNAALEALPPADHCFEFRHESWFKPEVRKLLERQGASLVLADDARVELPKASPIGKVVYLRFHYGSGRRGTYPGRELDQWMRRIAAWRSHREVFAYFNNDSEGIALRNASTLRRGLS